MIVNGTQQALDLIGRVLLNPGDRVLMEEPHYTGARCAFLSAGAELVLSPVDDHGIRIPKPIPGRRPIRLAYVTPSHSFRMEEYSHWPTSGSGLGITFGDSSLG